jgi:hypothetical protein
MRLSDAGLRCRQTKLIYHNHRLPRWRIEDAARDRSNRLLDDTHRSCNRAHRSCHSLTSFAAPLRPCTGRPLRSILRQPTFPRKRRSRVRPQRRPGMLRRFRATASQNEVVLTGPSKWASSSPTSARIPRPQRQARRRITIIESSPPSCRLTMRLSDAGLHRRQTKALYLHHRLSSLT